jgi:hypothetical protein
MPAQPQWTPAKKSDASCRAANHRAAMKMNHVMPNDLPMLRVRTNVRAGRLTVYGAATCAWTQKQRAYLDRKGLPYAFVDCSAQPCPPFVSGYPTLDNDGHVSVGYQEI